MIVNRLPIMALLMIALLPAALAFSGAGSGTIGDPYVITTPSEFNEMRDNLTAYYELGNDLDFSGYNNYTSPTGDWNNYFTGAFDGNNYTISNLQWVHTDPDYTQPAGVFGAIDLASDKYIRNVIFENYELIVNNSYETTCCGGALIGADDSSVAWDMRNVHFRNSVYDARNTIDNGGMVGYFSGNMNEIYNISFEGDVYGGGTFGGLTGFLINSEVLRESYFTGNIYVKDMSNESNTSGSAAKAGGLAGNLRNDAQVIDSYFLGNISVLNPSQCSSNFFGECYLGSIGGQSATGNPIIKNSYSSAILTNHTDVITSSDWGRVQTGTPLCEDSYYNSDLLTPKFSVCGTNMTSLTTDQFDDKSALTGFNFTTVWVIDFLSTPKFQWQNASDLGSEYNPYKIYTLSDWNAIQARIDEGEYGGSFSGPARNTYYELMNDLDIGANTLDTSAGAVWGLILNGNNHTLTFSASSGLFGDSLASSTPTSGRNKLELRNMIVDGTLSSVGSNGGMVAGFAFPSTMDVVIEDVKFTGSISETGTYSEMGSIYGQHLPSSSTSVIRNVYSDVSLTSAGDAGGLISNARSISIEDSYYYGVLNATNNAGGLVEDGCCGATASNSYFDSDLAGTTASFIGVAKTTSELKNISTYSGWDISAGDNESFTWGIISDANAGYAFLTALEDFTVVNFEAFGDGNTINEFCAYVTDSPSVQWCTTNGSLISGNLAYGVYNFTMNQSGAVFEVTDVPVGPTEFSVGDEEYFGKFYEDHQDIILSNTNNNRQTIGSAHVLPFPYQFYAQNWSLSYQVNLGMSNAGIYDGSLFNLGSGSRRYTYENGSLFSVINSVNDQAGTQWYASGEFAATYWNETYANLVYDRSQVADKTGLVTDEVGLTKTLYWENFNSGTGYVNRVSMRTAEETLVTFEGNDPLGIYECTAITQSGTFTLKNNVTGSISTESFPACLSVESSNVVLELGNYEVDDNAGGRSILIQSGNSNITVNGGVTEDNVELRGSNTEIVFNGTQVSELSRAVSLQNNNHANIIFDNVTLTSTTADTLEVLGSFENLTVMNSQLTADDKAIDISGTSNGKVILRNNVLQGNTQNAVRANGELVVSSNTFIGGEFGLSISNSASAEITSNDFTGAKNLQATSSTGINVVGNSFLGSSILVDVASSVTGTFADNVFNGTGSVLVTSNVSLNGTVDELSVSHSGPSPARDGNNYVRQSTFEVTRDTVIVEVDNIQNLPGYPLRIRVYSDGSLGTLLSTTITDDEDDSAFPSCCAYEYTSNTAVNIPVSTGNFIVVDYQGGTGGVEVASDIESDFLVLNKTEGNTICNAVYYPNPHTACGLAMDITTAESVQKGNTYTNPSSNGYSDSCLTEDGLLCYEPFTTNGATDYFTVALGSPTPQGIFGITCPSIFPNEGNLPQPAKFEVTFDVFNFNGYTSPTIDNLLKGSADTGVGDESACSFVANSGLNRTYNCNVSMNYWYAAENYAANVTFVDGSSQYSVEEAGACTYGQLLASERTTNTLGFPDAAPGISDSLANTPLNIKNTGNVEFDVSLTAYDLIGRSSPSITLAASAFKAGLSLGSAQQLSHGVTTNLSATVEPAQDAQEDIFFWLSMPANQAIQDYYAPDSWTVVIS